MRGILVAVLLFAGLYGWAQPAEDQLDFTVFLIGDAGEIKPYSEPLLTDARERMLQYGDKGAVVFLGDNIYTFGLPPESADDRKEMEAKIKQQVDVFADNGMKGVVLPGNHDWAKGKPNGLENILEQQEYIDKQTGTQDSFLPRDGCPGPVEVKLHDDLVLIVVDTQWLLVEVNEPDRFGHCEYQTRDAVTDAVAQIVGNNADKNVIFAAHHPIITYGSHGGIFQFKQHIFPLSDMKKWLLIPLPVLGSIYPIYRKSIGNIQDATSNKYQAIMAPMVDSFEKHQKVIHAAGHEHALEHLTRNNVEFIVSGSGSKTEFVKKKEFANYVSGDNGYSQVYYYANGEVWMDFRVFNAENPKGEVLYKTQLFN